MNKCLDKGFSSKAAKRPREPKEVSKPAAAASEVSIKKAPELNIEDAVPNCPICGKVFQTHNVAKNVLHIDVVIDLFSLRLLPSFYCFK